MARAPRIGQRSRGHAQRPLISVTATRDAGVVDHAVVFSSLALSRGVGDTALEMTEVPFQ